MDLISYKRYEEKLKELNPFYRWHLLDVEIKHSKVATQLQYSKNNLYDIIPFEKMQYGDSIFTPMSPKAWRKVRKFIFLPKYDKIKVKWRKGELRIWSLVVPPQKLRKPLRTFKIKPAA